MTALNVRLPYAYRTDCYICTDPSYAAAGLPICRACPNCTDSPGEENGHIPADDIACSVCGYDTDAAGLAML